MNSHLPPEQRAEMPEPDVALRAAADARGVALDPDRLLQLTQAAHNLLQREKYPNIPPYQAAFYDRVNELQVGGTAFNQRFGVAAASLDFHPPLPEEADLDLVIGATTPQPEHATLFLSMVLRGMQNYALLVEAGIVPKPDILYGTTNPQMAIAAERCGLLSDLARRYPDRPALAHKLMREEHMLEVSGSFDDVSARLFSDETKRLQNVLDRRRAAHNLAALAV